MLQAWPLWKYAVIIIGIALFAFFQLRQGKNKNTIIKQVGIGLFMAVALIWAFDYFGVK